MAENIVELKNVNLAYNKDYCALYDINLELKKGDRVCIYGETGSGKTALLRLIAGLEKHKSGECLLKGIPVNKVNFARDVSLGYLSTKAVFFERKSVYKNLMWTLKVHRVDKKERKERIENVLKEFGIENLRDEKVKNLCASDRRLTQIARMSMRPLEIVLCDDVLAEYDDMDTKARIRKAILKLFDSAPKDKVIIMTSQDRKSCEGVASKFIEIKLGSFVDNNKDDTKKESTVSKKDKKSKAVETEKVGNATDNKKEELTTAVVEENKDEKTPVSTAEVESANTEVNTKQETINTQTEKLDDAASANETENVSAITSDEQEKDNPEGSAQKESTKPNSSKGKKHKK